MTEKIHVYFLKLLITLILSSTYLETHIRILSGFYGHFIESLQEIYDSFNCCLSYKDNCKLFQLGQNNTVRSEVFHQHFVYTLQYQLVQLIILVALKFVKQCFMTCSCVNCLYVHLNLSITLLLGSKSVSVLTIHSVL